MCRFLPGFPLELSTAPAVQNKGKCDRGVNCKFFHDPAVVQDGAKHVRAERLDHELELT